MKRSDIVTLLVVAAMVVLQVRFCWLDDRPPSDLGHYYNSFRSTLIWWRAQHEINWDLVDTPYSLLLAAVGTVVTPSVAFVEWLDGGWLLLLLIASAAAARAVAGPVAGAVAVTAVAAFPQTLVITRTHWIHHPETAAIAVALAAWLASPGLTSWMQAGAVGVFLFFGETIRQTGVPFGMPLGLFVLVGAWRRGARARLFPVILAIVGGAAWWAPKLNNYVHNKANAAEQYAKSVGSPWPWIVENLGLPTLIWAVPLALLGVLALRRKDLSSLVAGLCLVWIAGGLAAVAIFKVGPDNFPVSGLGLAILAGIGAAQVRWSWATVGAGLVVAALIQIPPLLSTDLNERLPAALQAGSSSGPINYRRVYWSPVTVEDVLPAVDRVCSEAEKNPLARCFILASRGLFNPSWEDGGTFALFLSGRPKATVVTPEVLWNNAGRASGVTPRVHAFVDVTCAAGAAPSTGGRFQTQFTKASELFSRYAEDPIGTFGDPKACVQTWYSAPNGGALVQ